MAVSGFLFVLLRMVQLFFLIPPLGMLSALVHGFVSHNLLTPSFVLVLFIGIVLASVWVLLTLLFYSKARHNGYLLAFVDLALFATLIAGLVVARHITGKCNASTNYGIYFGQWDHSVGSACSLLKASWAFTIIEVILFFNSIWLALLVHRHHAKEDEKTYRRSSSSHRSRHSGRRRSASRSGGSRADTSRSRSRARYDSRNYDSRDRGYSRSRSRV